MFIRRLRTESIRHARCRLARFIAISPKAGTCQLGGSTLYLYAHGPALITDAVFGNRALPKRPWMNKLKPRWFGDLLRISLWAVINSIWGLAWSALGITFFVGLYRSHRPNAAGCAWVQNNPLLAGIG